MATKEVIKEREKEKHEMSDNEVIGHSQAGPIEEIKNLKKRQRAIYYRPVKHGDGSVEWQPTQLLPSDMQGRELYLSKGFRLSPPKPTDTATPEQVTAEQEREVLLAENQRLRQLLSEKPVDRMAKARAARKVNKVLPSDNGKGLGGSSL